MMCDELDKGYKAQKPERKVEAVVGELSKVSHRFPGVLGHVKIAKPTS